MSIFYNRISVFGDYQEKQRFKNNLENCLTDRNCTCNLTCPLTKLLKSKKHCSGKNRSIGVYATKHGLDFDVVTKNTTLEHAVKTIARNYPGLIFKVSATSDSSDQYVSETFVYRNNLTLVADSRTADKDTSRLDCCGQLIMKGCTITTAKGDVMVINDISANGSTISVLCNVGCTATMNPDGLDLDDITRLNYWDSILDFVIERVNIDPSPHFEAGNATISNQLAEQMETFSGHLTPQICLILVGHSYGFWGEAEESFVAKNNLALKHKSGHLISKHKFLDDRIVVFTDATWTQTKMFLESEVPSSQET